jgi:DNA/RNA-binding domain of Phe-tRNA-synthetase-like protein
MTCSLCPRLSELLRIDEPAARLGIHVAYTVACGEPVGSLDSSTLDDEITRLLSELRSRYTIDSLKDDRLVRAYRDFYWRIGVDPTKTRPSSEALVRRILRGRFPRIHPIVDAGNAASAATMVPIGLYDVRYFRPPLRLTVARGGEVFNPIGGHS